MTSHMFRILGSALMLLALTTNVHGTTTDIANAPLVTSPTASVLPNILYVLDDSGSMNWNYLPDWANDNPYGSNATLQKNAGFNGVYYDPAVTYTPPTSYNADGTVNATKYPSMTSANSTAWTYVPRDGFGVQSSSHDNLVGSAEYYTFIAGEYCTALNLKTCNTQSAPTPTYSYPATLRWCSSSAMTNCQASWINSGSTIYTNARYPTSATITVSGTSSTTVSGITVNSKQIMSGTTTASTNSSSVAAYIAAQINACTASSSGNCTIAGYSAITSGNNVIIIPPSSLAAAAISYATPTIAQSGSMTITATAFTGGAPGSTWYTSITSGVNSYPYPGSATKAASRTDCAGSTCTYAEEMTNYANWWAYYHTRMQMMKTSATLAFATLGASYRVGYMSINNNTGSDFLNLDTFSLAHKADWYTKFTSATPGSTTPLRTALTKAGRLYAGKYNGSTLNGSTVTDPIQYSCQQNFTIMSTDGYWNGTNNPKKVDGTTDVGNQDGTEPRPYYDGAAVQQTTTQVQESQTQVTQSTSQLQKRIQQIQRQTQQLQESDLVTQKVSGQLYTRTSSNSGSTWSDWSATSTCTQDSSGSSRRECIVGTLETRTSSDHGSTWSSWSSTASCTTDNSGTNQRQCQVVQNWSTVASCTPTRTGSSGSYSYTGNAAAVDCQTSSSPWSNVSSCTASATVQCQTTTTGWINVSSCTASGPTNGQTITCQTSDTGWVGASSCTASGPTNGQTITCQTATTGPTLVASCTPANPTSGNNYTQTTCTTNTIMAATPVDPATCSAGNSGSPNYITTSCNTVTNTTNVGSCTAQSAAADNNWTTTTCGAGSGGTTNTLADTAEYYYITDLRTSALGNCTSGSSGNTLCSASSPDPYNNVPKSGDDAASWQHMTTYTLGLGASGFMQYQSGYASTTSGDFFDVKNGTTATPASGICSWQSSGACNWPIPTSNTQTTIDDLWHAAVDGRGTYYSATNPTSLSSGLSSALSGVSARTGASAAATTSNPNVVTGDNFVFSSTFVSQDWTGQLVRQHIDLNTGQVSPTADWAARGQLELVTYSNRAIYTFDPTNTYNGGNGTKLKLFTYANLTPTEQAYFNTPDISSLSQFCASGCLSASDQVVAAGANLVNFLRGDRTNEGTTNTKYYRTRKYLLGDIVDAEAAYVSKPQAEYTDYGYSSPSGFLVTNASREPMVYAAANDGMLHAFYATDNTALGHVGGAEAWAYIPPLVLPNLYKLADKNYANQHQYYVDGTPTVADVCISSCNNNSAVWKTILVGGLNAGGRGYYALDVTDPANPIALWEFTDTNMGYTFGNPKIGKLKNGTWVVLLTSGYNNVSPGDGQGHLYVLNAYTGTLNTTVNPSGTTPGVIDTGVGDTTTPSGLGHISARALNPTKDNTILEVYGGDLLGNVWRFDINGDVGASGYDAQLLATLKGAGGVAQPISSKPEVGLIGNDVLVFVGTGRYLGATDLSDTNPQSMYAIKDPLSTGTTPGTAIYANPRSDTCASASSTNCFVEQTYTVGTCPIGTPTNICKPGETVRINDPTNSVNLATQYGWFADFPDNGERDNTDPALALGVLGFTTNIPDSSACTVGGYSQVCYVDYRNGGPLSSSPTHVLCTKLGNSIATRPVFVELPNGTVIMLIMTSDSGGGSSGGSAGSTNSAGCIGDECNTAVTPQVYIPPQPTATTSTRRTSWRELIKE